MKKVTKLILPLCQVISVDRESRVRPRQANPEPNEREQRIGEPIQPTEILLSIPFIDDEIHPDVEELVRADARDEVWLEPVCAQILLRDVVVALEWCDASSERPLSEEQTGGPVGYPDVSTHRLSHRHSSFPSLSNSSCRFLQPLCRAARDQSQQCTVNDVPHE